MEPIDSQDLISLSEEQREDDVFGKAPQPWQLRNNWVKPKRKRKPRRVEIDIWAEES